MRQRARGAGEKAGIEQARQRGSAEPGARAPEELPPGQQEFRALNADLAKQWPVITEMKEAPPDAKDWDGKPGKLGMLER